MILIGIPNHGVPDYAVPNFGIPMIEEGGGELDGSATTTSFAVRFLLGI